MVWGWPGKMDYLAKMVPGSPAFVQQLITGGTDWQGKGDTERVLGFLGSKTVPVDPLKTAVNLAYARDQEIQKRQASLRQQGINADHPTPEYRRLSEQLKIVRQVQFQGKAQAGYKVLPKSGAPKKPRIRRSSPSTSSGSGGGSFFGGGSSSSGSSSGGSFFGD